MFLHKNKYFSEVITDNGVISSRAYQRGENLQKSRKEIQNIGKESLVHENIIFLAV